MAFFKEKKHLPEGTFEHRMEAVLGSVIGAEDVFCTEV